MTGIALGINASGGSPSYNARAFRSALAGLGYWDGVALSAREGIRPMGGSAANFVTLAGSTITVTLHAGRVAPTWSTLTGPYMVALTVNETHSLTAQGAQPRKDIVIGRVYDDDESTSGLRLYRSEYIAGTPAGSPLEPNVPTGAIKLATIDVPASGGGSPVVTMSHKYSVEAGGVLPVRNQTERDALSNPSNGQIIYRQDRKWNEIYDGGAWRVQGTATCSTTSDRDSAITSPIAGQLALVTTEDLVYRYTGSVWVYHNFFKKTVTLGASSANIDITGIPSTFRHVKLVWSVRSTLSAVADGLRLRVNGNTGSAYFENGTIQVNTTIVPYQNFPGTGGFLGNVLAATAANANGHGSGHAEIPGWNNPNTRNQLNWTYSSHAADTAVDIWRSDGGVLYAGNGPYTQLTLYGSANLAAGSTATVYAWE